MQKTMARKLIAFTGKAGAGKDTAAGWLVHNYGFEPVTFAGPLKAGLAAMGMPEPRERHLKEEKVPGFDFTWRHAAQTLGTEWGRQLDQNLWIKLALHKADNFPYVVFTDTRFDNEAEAIRKMGGVIVHLSGRQVNLGTSAGHVSELPVTFKDGDLLLENTGSIEELYEKIDEIYFKV